MWWQCWEVFIIWKNGRSCGDPRLCKRMHMLVWVLLVALPCLLVDVWWFWYGQNGVLPLSKKLSSILPNFSNYLGKCPCCETWFLDNQVIAELDLKKKKKIGTRVPFEYFWGTQVPQFFFFFFQFTIIRLSKNWVLNWNLIFRKSSFKTEAFP